MIMIITPFSQHCSCNLCPLTTVFTILLPCKPNVIIIDFANALVGSLCTVNVLQVHAWYVNRGGNMVIQCMLSFFFFSVADKWTHYVYAMEAILFSKQFSPGGSSSKSFNDHSLLYNHPP